MVSKSKPVKQNECASVEPPAPLKAAPTTPTPVKTTGYVVAEGKSICCGTGAGILKPGDAIKPEHLSADAEQAKTALEHLVSSGAVKAI